MTKSRELIELFARFGDAGAREDAASELALALGVERVLLFVRDPDVGSLVPAPGFPQTIRGGPAWRTFVRACTRPGCHTAEVEALDCGGAATVRVTAHVTEMAALFLFGRDGDPTLLAEMLAIFPLIGGIVRAEHMARLARGEAEVARAAGRHASNLAVALDTARADVERALAESARLNAELGERDRKKDDFLAMLGHELRNPMAAISGAIEVMRSRPDDPAQVAKAGAILERQVEQLTRLVDDLLDVARITRGKVVLRREPLELGAVAQRAVEPAQGAAAAKGHTLDLDVRALVFVDADRTRLEQMITNLLTNAIKYTDDGGHIRVTVDADRADAVITVADDGIGIAKDVLPTVFDAFNQVDSSIDRGAGGLGVGLTVVRRLVELHGGRVDAKSELGRGSTFSIRIPSVAPPTTTAVAAVPPVASPERAPALASSLRRILVVDDNVDSAEMIVAMLEDWGHEAHHVVDGPTAVERALELRPDIVLLDIGLPGMDGHEVAARLRAEPTTKRVRIIALSGYGQESDRVKSRAAGCDEHLVKPVDMNLLRRTLTADAG